METQSQRDILNRSSGLQSDAKYNKQYQMVMSCAPASPLKCGSPFSWHQTLNQSVDAPLVAGAFPFQGDRRAFTRVNGTGSAGSGAWCAPQTSDQS